MTATEIKAVVFLTCAVVLVLTWLGLPPGHSSAPNFAWSVQYTQTISWTNPMPKYLPGLWQGLGGHDFFFYAPLPFWFIAAIVAPLCPGCSPSTEFVLGSSLLFAMSGLSMFAFLRTLFSAGPSAIGALAYMVLPYHLLMDWFERQAVGEFTAYAFLPLIALGVERLRTQDRPGWSLTIGVAGLSLCHLPTLLLAAHVFALVICVMAVRDRETPRDAWRFLGRTLFFATLGVALTCFYWLPAIILLDTVSPTVLFDPFFQPWRWLLGTPLASVQMDAAMKVLATFVACLPILVVSGFIVKGTVRVWIFVPALFVVFMNTSLSELIWREWIIAKVQFPWRLMVFVDFATGAACAALAAWAINGVRRVIAGAAVVLAAVPALLLSGYITFSMRGTSPEAAYYDWFGAIEYLSPEMTRAISLRIGQDGLQHFDQIKIGKALPELLSEFRQTRMNGAILDQGHRTILVQPTTSATRLALPVQYWFLWQAEMDDGTPLIVKADPAFGTLSVVAPPRGFGQSPVKLTLAYHSSERMGWAISLLAVITITSGLLWRRLNIPRA